MNKIRTLFRLAAEVYDLVRGYGRKKLAWVFFWMVVQGAFQVAGVASIFPFLALAADPAAVRDSAVGSAVLGRLPLMTDQQLLVGAGMLSVLFLVTANGVMLFGAFQRSRFAQGVALHVRRTVLRRLATRSYGYFLSRNSSALYQKIGDDSRALAAQLINPLLDLGASVLTVLALLASILVVDPLLPVVAASVLAVAYAGVFRWTRPRLVRLGQRLRATNQLQARGLSQFLQGVKTVMVYGRSEHFIGTYDRSAAEQATLLPKLPVYQQLPRGVIESVAFGGLVLMVVLEALRGNGVAAILPQVSVLALAGYRMLPETQRMYSNFAMVMTYHYLARELGEELRSEDDEVEAPTHDAETSNVCALTYQAALCLRGISFRYPTAKQPVFESLDLTIPKNTSLGIVGPTGCGKSTLVDLILGLHTPSAGQILVDDHPLTTADMPAWRRMIGYVSQDIFLLDDTVAANIAFGIPPEEIDQDALVRAAEAAQIRGFVEDELPQSWDTVVGERGVRLSGGQRQRIGLARALYHAPSVLILDEATSALDHETESMVLQAIQNLHGTVTMIVIAHRLNTIENCDAVFRMEPHRTAEADASA